MKKLYQDKKWKAYSKKRSEAVLRSCSGKRRKRKPIKKKVAFTYGKAHKQKDLVTIDVPSNFSLIENPEEMLSFFHDVRLHLKNGRRIFFNMSAISTMTTDAILYMLSRFDYYRQHLPHHSISGNTPTNDECRYIFINSGFYKYVHASGIAKSQRTHDVLTVQSGSQVDPEIAKDVTHFARERLGDRDTQISKSMYSTLIE